MQSKDPTYSGFARFSDFSSRDRFIHRLLDADSELRERAYSSESRPTIVFSNLTTEQHQRIRSALQGVGEWFEDVAFRPL